MSYFEDFRHIGFKPNPSNKFREEFNRLAQKLRLKTRTVDWHERRREALKAEFRHHFDFENGTSKLENWQALCDFLGEPRGESKTKCIKILRRVNVNIWDMIDQARTGEKATKFKTRGELMRYTKNNGQIYPLAVNKEAGGVDDYLKVLLKRLS